MKGALGTVLSMELWTSLDRNDYSKWHEALEQCRDEKTRQEWSKAGIERIKDLKMSPKIRQRKIHNLLNQVSRINS